MTTTTTKTQITSLSPRRGKHFHTENLEAGMNDCPLLIEFVSNTQIYREPEIVPKLPIVQNGPPGTFVVFADGTRVPLPTDQIVLADRADGRARVGFGGMSFEGMEEGRLVFYRVRDLKPEWQLSPERGRKMTLKPHMVSAIYVDGREVWPLLQAMVRAMGDLPA